MTLQANILLAMSLDLVEQSNAIRKMTQIAQLLRKHNRKQLNSQFGKILWLTEDNSLYRFNIRHDPSIVGNTKLNVEMIGFTADYLYLVVLSKRKNQRVMMTIWKSLTED